MNPTAAAEERIIWLHSTPRHPSLVGQKAANLQRLIQYGIPVPSGFCVTTEALSELLSLMTAREDQLSGPRKAACIQQTVLERAFPSRLQNELVRSVGELERTAKFGKMLAIRSSAIHEDLSRSSFAGAYETILGVVGVTEVEAAIRMCWGSMWNDRVASYRTLISAGDDTGMMGVIVQELVPADVSLVIFSADPITGDDGRILVDATFGLGDTLVEGVTTPDHLVLGSSGTVLDYLVGDKSIMSVCDPRFSPSLQRLLVPETRRRRPALDAGHIETIVGLVRSLRELYTYHVDVEAALIGSELFVLQVRPVSSRL